MSSLEQLGAFVAGYHPDAEARAAVRRHVADTVGAWIAATATTEGQSLLKFRAADAAALSNRVAIHCALARLSEVDDIHLAAMITPGAIVVPAALTIAAALPETDAAEVVAAIVSGYEAMVRLGIAIDGPTVLYRGIWPSYFAAPFGVAAVAARLMRLDAGHAAHALATALLMAAPGTGHHAAVTTARWLAVGHAAARGLQAAQAAQSGFTSDTGIADGDFLKNVYGISPDIVLLARGAGGLALEQVSYKPWCAARQTMAATQALKEVLAEGVDPQSIARIGVAVLPAHQKMIDHGVTPGDRFSHLTSAPYQLALAALAPDAAYALTPGPLLPAVSAFMKRVQLRAEEGLVAADYPRAWAAHITIATAGKRHQRSVTHVPGDPGRPFSENDLRQKFIRVAASVLDAEQAGAAFNQALDAVENPAGMLAEIERIASGAKASAC
jgi:2-methylcitrate dehydratase PrpD